MESKDKLRETDIKIVRVFILILIRFLDRDIEFSDFLLDAKLYKENLENILVDDISYKTSAGATPLRIRFNKIDGFIKINENIRYCDKIKYLISEKSGITDSINHNFARIGID